MSEKTFEGKTRAEWLTFRGKSGIGCPHPAKTEEALLWFEAADKQAEIEREERRFQIQIDESRRQARAAVVVSVLALLVSLGTVAYQIWHDYHTKP